MSLLHDGAELVKVIYPDLLQPMMKRLGDNLSIIIDFMSLPLLRVKYFVAERQLRFRNRIERLTLELEKIPNEQRCEIPASIGVPAIDQLSIESDEEISNLFIQLDDLNLIRFRR